MSVYKPLATVATEVTLPKHSSNLKGKGNQVKQGLWAQTQGLGAGILLLSCHIIGAANQELVDSREHVSSNPAQDHQHLWGGSTRNT